jgi:hypothetical protein
MEMSPSLAVLRQAASLYSAVAGAVGGDTTPLSTATGASSGRNRRQTGRNPSLCSSSAARPGGLHAKEESKPLPSALWRDLQRRASLILHLHGGGGGWWSGGDWGRVRDRGLGERRRTGQGWGENRVWLVRALGVWGLGVWLVRVSIY